VRAAGLRRTVVAVGSLVVIGLLAATEVQAASPSDAPVCRGTGKRFALLIGNQDYKGVMSTLANPRRDTQAFANLLCGNGFTVFRHSDLDIANFDAALAQFANVTRGAQTSLVYYSGHGFAAGGRNWLVPIDALLDCDNLGNAENADVNFLQRRLVDLSSGVLGRLDGSGDQIVILDACRTDPIRSCFRGGAGLTLVKGFDRVSTSSGRLVLYATQNGKPARDTVAGSDISPLMTAIVKKLPAAPQRDWLSAMGDVSREVAALTRHEQVPNLDVSIPPQGCLAGNCEGTTVLAPPKPAVLWPPVTPEPPSVAAAVSAGGYLVQVSSQRNEADAQASFRLMQSKYPSVLGSVPWFIKKADLGDKGTYYRGMVGPFGSVDEAAQLCSSLKTAGGQCVILRN